MNIMMKKQELYDWKMRGAYKSLSSATLKGIIKGSIYKIRSTKNEKVRARLELRRRALKVDSIKATITEIEDYLGKG